MEQHVNNTRTVKTMGTNGLESFTTVVLNSLHYESQCVLFKQLHVLCSVAHCFCATPQPDVH